LQTCFPEFAIPQAFSGDSHSAPAVQAEVTTGH